MSDYIDCKDDVDLFKILVAIEDINNHNWFTDGIVVILKQTDEPVETWIYPDSAERWRKATINDIVNLHGNYSSFQY